MKKALYLLYLLIPLAIALSLRLYPTLITGMPFSTDGWPIIRNTELLIKNTPIALNSNIFDGYNNFMPANSIFSAILSQVTSIAPINAMALGMPIVGALAIPIFYVLVNRITKNSKVSLHSINPARNRLPIYNVLRRSNKRNIRKPNLHAVNPDIPT